MGYFFPFYFPNSPINQNLKKMKTCLKISSFYNSGLKIMIICCTVPKIWHVADVIIFHFGPFFPFYSPNNLKSHNFEKMKNTHGDIIILHKHTINDNHNDVWFMRYWVWQTEFFVILYHCLPFYPPNNPKIKILKNWKRHLEILSFYTSVLKIMIICYTVP